MIQSLFALLVLGSLIFLPLISYQNFKLAKAQKITRARNFWLVLLILSSITLICVLLPILLFLFLTYSK